MIARLDATVSFLADALKAFGDRDPEDLRRVKAVAVLANPAQAVELLAAFAALRSRTLDVDLDVNQELPMDEPDAPDDSGHSDRPTACDQPTDALGRMDDFARRIGFRPTRLPGFLASPADIGLDRLDQPGLDRLDRPARFTFDWLSCCRR